MKANKYKAFTLIEALIATLVFSIVVSIIFSVVQYAQRSLLQVKNQSAVISQVYMFDKILSHAFENCKTVKLENNTLLFDMPQQTITLNWNNEQLILQTNNSIDSLQFTSIDIEEIGLNELDLVTFIQLNLTLESNKQIPLYFSKAYSKEQLWRFYDDSFIEK